jgi:hypothetical protein
MASKWINNMNDNSQDIEQCDEDTLTFEVSDEALEVAASTTAGAAMSFPGSPTVSILVACCSNDYTDREQKEGTVITLLADTSA